MWEIEYTDEFGGWWDTLEGDEQADINTYVTLLLTLGPALKFPYSSGINRSKHSRMRELRVQHRGKPYRIFYAFDPRRTAILLIGGIKAGDDRWYEKYIPMADNLYDIHIETLKKEELIHG